MKKLTVFLCITFILVFLLFVASCKKKECGSASECPEQANKITSCSEGKCSYREVSCTMPVKIKEGGKDTTAKYLTYQKNNATKKCDVIVKNARLERIVDEKVLPFFKLSTIISFTQPFDITKDNFVFEFQLKDITKELELPVKLTNIQIIDKENLIADNDINVQLNRIGDKAKIQIPVTYDLKAEEERALGFKIDYEHEQKAKEGKQTFRKDYTGSFKRKVILVNPERVAK